MMNPVAPGLQGSLIVAPIDLDRPVSLPEPAREVTPVGPALNGALPDTRAGKQVSGAVVYTAQGQLDGMNSLEKALHLVNNNLKAWSTGMRFDLDADAQRIVVSIVDSDTGEVLRTVPSDAVIRVAKMIVQLQEKSIDTQA
jgi:flagellar protein FlaG